jgi:hypothetical protein
MIVIASGNLLSSSFAQGGQNFTANMTSKEDVVGVHSPEFGFEENIDSVNGTVQRSGITNPLFSYSLSDFNSKTSLLYELK